MLRVCPWLMPWVVCATLIRLSARASCHSPDSTDECMAQSIGFSMLQMRRNLLMVQPEGSKSSQNRTFLDAIIVLGGGLTDAGLPTPWVEARLARAKAIYDSVAGPSHSGKPHLICSGKGTANEAGAGDDITEAEACARFLVERSVPPHDILQEPLSRDTVGNAFFSRIVHTDFLGAKKVAVVTSKFHMPRTRVIFNHIFSLPSDSLPRGTYALSFEETPNVGVSSEDLLARLEKERDSIHDYKAKMGRFACLRDLHDFIFADHLAYASDGRLRSTSRALDKRLAGTYGLASGIRRALNKSDPHR